MILCIPIIRYIYSFVDDLLVTCSKVSLKHSCTSCFCFTTLSTTAAIICSARTAKVLLLALISIGTTLSDHVRFAARSASFDFGPSWPRCFL
jgi:hypothetical protein